MDDTQHATLLAAPHDAAQPTVHHDAAQPTAPHDAAQPTAPLDAAQMAAPHQRLSKAEKRARKAESLKERRAKKREHQKVGRRKQVEGRREEHEARFQAMAPEEQAAFKLADKQSRERRYNEVCEQTSRVDEALKSGLRVAVDLSYGSFMDPKEQKSLGRQLARCWGSNRRAAAPLSLHLAALDDCPAACLPEEDVHLRWKVHRLQRGVAEHFESGELVFLSPDSPHVLHELDHAKVYVIGGLVDRSVQKTSSLSRAAQLGVSTARLPLVEHAPLLDARLPLTLTAVVDILLGVNAGGGWADAITAALPMRKMERPHEEARAQRRLHSRKRRPWDESGSSGACGGEEGGDGEEEGEDEGEDEGEEEEQDEGQDDEGMEQIAEVLGAAMSKRQKGQGCDASALGLP